MLEPTWVPRIVVESIHFEQIREHGGLPGLRDEALLESALAYPRQKYAYQEGVDIFALAAAYCFTLLRNHPFHDGNKRIAFLTMVVFLGLNGIEFAAGESEVVSIILDASAGRFSESDLTKWIQDHSSE